MTTATETAKRINVTLSAYEGDDFENADDLFEDYVLSTLTDAYPGAKIEISTAQGSTKVFVDGVPDLDLAGEIAQDWWTSFCESETVADDPVIHIAISVGTPSQFYPDDEQRRNGALDYDVTLAIGDRVVEGGITLYRDDINGGMGACGSPLDGWCSGTILAAIEGLPESRRKAVIASLATLSDGEVE